ncbi:NADH-quinone oxidoreductase subunit NuoN [bacterium]|nr:NADH-quinone oxidoreductase subunit NuoN [bacterium]
MNIVLSAIRNAVDLILPEVALLATVCMIFLAAPFLVSERGEAAPGLRHRWGWLSLIGLSVAAYLWSISEIQPVGLGPFRLDGLAWFIRGLSLASGLILVLVNWNQAEDARAGETQACLLAIIAGVNLVAAANDIVGLFVALELISIPTYIFLLMPRRDALAQESMLKYFMLSIFSSATLLFGMSYLYGLTGTTHLEGIYASLQAGQSQPMPLLVTIAAVMMIAGLAFRLTAVPFHFYAPDVFQGAPNSVAAMLSFIPKVAGFVALYRVLAVTIPSGDWSMLSLSTPLLWWLAVLTMFVGNLLALLQNDVRRMLAFSSVSHAGYMLVGFVVGDAGTKAISGYDALLFYLSVYGAMTIGTFATLAALSTSSRRVSAISDLDGLSQTRPVIAIALTFFLLSLMGMPFTAGFVGKLNLFLVAWNSGGDAGQWLAIWLAVNAAIGAWYYLRLIREMYLSDPVTEVGQEQQPAVMVAIGLCTLATMGLFMMPEWLWQAIQKV